MVELAGWDLSACGLRMGELTGPQRELALAVLNAALAPPAMRRCGRSWRRRRC